MSFYICHCGNTVDNHNFRHEYKNICRVARNIDENLNEFYVLNAEDFPVKKGVKCGKKDCHSHQNVHETQILQHKFEPFDYNYREIKFTLPYDSVCNRENCVILKNHHKVLTHHFTTKITILNKNENDLVYICDPEDEDNKIIWQ
jgi:hypothetical protein